MLGRRETITAAAGGVLLAAVMHGPVVARLASHVPAELTDPLLQAWQVAWGGHALVHETPSLFDANVFWPHRHSLAFSDSLLGYAPAGLVGSGPEAALLRYNLLFLFSYALAFAGAYVLAREMGFRPVAATVAGAAFAYAPWRISQQNHLHVLSSGGIPLAIGLLLRGYRRQRPRALVAGWAVAAWQLSLGWVLGLQLGYLLPLLGGLLVAVWLWRGRPRPGRGVVAGSVAGVVLFGLAAAAMALPYLQVVECHPGARRSLDAVRAFSPPKAGLLAAPENSLVWGAATAGVREGLRWAPEQSLFPGVAIAGLAAAGVVASRRRRGLRFGLAAGTALALAMSLGLELAGGRFTYRLVHAYLPGWDAIRVPGRLMTLVTLGLALLAAAGAETLRRRVPGRAAGRVLAAALVGAVLVEGAGGAQPVEVPDAPPAVRTAAPPLLHLPIGPDPLYVFWSTGGFPPVVNGYSGFFPQSYVRLYDDLARFPDRRSLAVLGDLGVRTVLYHTELARGTAWEASGSRSVDGLGVRRERHGDVVVFHLGGPAGPPEDQDCVQANRNTVSASIRSPERKPASGTRSSSAWNSSWNAGSPSLNRSGAKP